MAMRHLILISCFLIAATGFAQDFQSKLRRTKRLAIQDTVVIDTTSINPVLFEVLQKDGSILDTAAFEVDIVVPTHSFVLHIL